MDQADVVAARLNELVTRGNGVANGPRDSGQLTSGDYYGWRAQSLTYLQRVLGRGDGYCEAFESAVQGPWPGSVRAGVSILDALRDDVAGGYLSQLRNQVVQVVFGDFLEMADSLLAEGHKDPAAMLIGAVLEDSLRRMLDNASTVYRNRAGIDELSSACFDAGIYGGVQRSQIASWKEIRNKAAHGSFSDYSIDEVRLMLQGVQTFLGAHLPT